MKNDVGDPFINISIFGSAARGEHDLLSDLDIIAIVKDGAGKQDELRVLKTIKGLEQGVPSISWYGETKIRRFFQAGDLFAWHLFLESRPVREYRQIAIDFGKPNNFKDAMTSIVELETIYAGIPAAIHEAPQNVKFELGICYVCFRNIAMAASWHLCARPDFGRYSPYTLETPCFPLPRDIYDILWLCRISGQRGATPPDSEKIDLRWMLAQGSTWIREVKEALLDGGT